MHNVCDQPLPFIKAPPPWTISSTPTFLEGCGVTQVVAEEPRHLSLQKELLVNATGEKNTEEAPLIKSSRHHSQGLVSEFCWGRPGAIDGASASLVYFNKDYRSTMLFLVDEESVNHLPPFLISLDKERFYFAEFPWRLGCFSKGLWVNDTFSDFPINEEPEDQTFAFPSLFRLTRKAFISLNFTGD
ncbi:hypothetical protein CEXT_262651 [Caerostris extrusa]|uniref:Uncharacterized protein n=1 Tax=Caerostris extrusa TaxID=172846 RepID=A0AAV4R4H7_CAEEX|nr:hypothetical protein CEXT_262651 [Caerostris extrusa]